jgi:hypothetical protein
MVHRVQLEEQPDATEQQRSIRHGALLDASRENRLPSGRV